MQPSSALPVGEPGAPDNSATHLARLSPSRVTNVDDEHF